MGPLNIFKDASHSPQIPLENHTLKQNPTNDKALNNSMQIPIKPRGSVYTTILEIAKRPSLLWFWGLNAIRLVYMDPQGNSNSTKKPMKETQRNI